MKMPTTTFNINIAWSPDSNYIAVGNKSEIVSVMDVRGGGALVKRSRFPYLMNEFVWSANSDYLLAATGEGAIDIINPEDLKILETITAHVGGCEHLKVDSTYRRMAITSVDCVLSFWDLDDLVCHNTLSFESEIKTISFSGDGQYLAAVEGKAAIPENSTGIQHLAICNSDTGEFVTKITQSLRPREHIATLAWHPRISNLIAAGIDNNGVRLISFPNA